MINNLLKKHLDQIRDIHRLFIDEYYVGDDDFYVMIEHCLNNNVEGFNNICIYYGINEENQASMDRVVNCLQEMQEYVKCTPTQSLQLIRKIISEKRDENIDQEIKQEQVFEDIEKQSEDESSSSMDSNDKKEQIQSQQKKEKNNDSEISMEQQNILEVKKQGEQKMDGIQQRQSNEGKNDQLNFKDVNLQGKLQNNQRSQKKSQVNKIDKNAKVIEQPHLCDILSEQKNTSQNFMLVLIAPNSIQKMTVFCDNNKIQINICQKVGKNYNCLIGSCKIKKNKLAKSTVEIKDGGVLGYFRHKNKIQLKQYAKRSVNKQLIIVDLYKENQGYDQALSVWCSFFILNNRRIDNKMQPIQLFKYVKQLANQYAAIRTTINYQQEINYLLTNFSNHNIKIGKYFFIFIYNLYRQQADCILVQACFSKIIEMTGAQNDLIDDKLRRLSEQYHEVRLLVLFLRRVALYIKLLAFRNDPSKNYMEHSMTSSFSDLIMEKDYDIIFFCKNVSKIIPELFLNKQQQIANRIKFQRTITSIDYFILQTTFLNNYFQKNPNYENSTILLFSMKLVNQKYIYDHSCQRSYTQSQCHQYNEWFYNNKDHLHYLFFKFGKADQFRLKMKDQFQFYRLYKSGLQNIPFVGEYLKQNIIELLKQETKYQIVNHYDSQKLQCLIIGTPQYFQKAIIAQLFGVSNKSKLEFSPQNISKLYKMFQNPLCNHQVLVEYIKLYYSTRKEQFMKHTPLLVVLDSIDKNLQMILNEILSYLTIQPKQFDKKNQKSLFFQFKIVFSFKKKSLRKVYLYQMLDQIINKNIPFRWQFLYNCLQKANLQDMQQKQVMQVAISNFKNQLTPNIQQIWTIMNKKQQLLHYLKEVDQTNFNSKFKQIAERIEQRKITMEQLNDLINNKHVIAAVVGDLIKFQEIVEQIMTEVNYFKVNCQTMINILNQFQPNFDSQIQKIKRSVSFTDNKNISQLIMVDSQFAELFKVTPKLNYLINSSVFVKRQITNLRDLSYDLYNELQQCFRIQIKRFISGQMKVSQFQNIFQNQQHLQKLLKQCFSQLTQSNRSKIVFLSNILKNQYLNSLAKYLQAYEEILKYNKGVISQNKQLTQLKKIIASSSDITTKQLESVVYQAQKAVSNNYLIGVKDATDYNVLPKLFGQNQIIKIFVGFVENQDLFAIFQKLETKDKIIQDLKEYIEDLEHTAIGIQNIAEFQRVYNFYKMLIDQKLNQKQMIDLLKKQQKRHKTELSRCIKNCYALREQFRQIIWKTKHRQISFKYQIQMLLQNSTLQLKFQKGFKLQAVSSQLTSQSQISSKQKVITFAQMGLYKQKSMLLIRDMKKDNKMQPGLDSTIQLLQQFQILFTKLQRIYEFCQQLYNYGYDPKTLEFSVKIQNNNIQQIQRLLQLYEQKAKRWVKFIKEIYSKSFLLTHFIGPQLNLFIQQCTEGTYLPIYRHIFGYDQQKFARIKLNSQFKNQISKAQSTEDPQEKILAISEAFQVCDVNQGQKPNKINKIYTFLTITDIYCCLYDSKKSVCSSQVLYCQKSTSIEELEFFLYRALIHWSKRHFFILSSNLKEQIKLAFCDMLKKLVNQRKQQFLRANLCFINNKDDKIIGLLMESKIFQSEKKELFQKKAKQLTKNMLQIMKKTIIYESQRAGMGKTYQIEKQAKKQKSQLIYFPICGNINFQNLAARLKKIALKQQKYSLLLQIGHIQNKKSLQVFLAQLILFRSFYFQQYIFINPETVIYIQMENIYEEKNQKIEQNKYYILNILRKNKYIQKIAKFRLQDVDFDQNNLKDKFTFYYLDLLDSDRILKENLSYKYQYTGKQKKINLPNKIQCQKLIGKYFCQWFNKKNINPTFLLYRTFLNMAFLTVKCFSDASNLSIEEFQNLDDQYDVLKLDVLRSQFLKICINNTLECLEESVTTNDFSDHQDKSKLVDFRKKLKQLSLLIIPNSDFGYQFVYLDHKKVDLPIKSLLLKQNIKFNSRLYKIKNENQVFQLFDQSSFKGVKNHLLAKLCDMLYHISGNKQFQTIYDPNSNQNMKNEKLQEIIPELKHYKITIDNFFKMCFIILKSLCFAPIIIMGESGVGKTALISFMIEVLYKEKLFIYNVHAGIHEKNISQWVQQFTLAAKQNQQKRIWVFFDQFNTSDELSYFKEIIIDRRFMGNKLPQNIVFLSACNPYRKKKQSQFKSGLVYKTKEAQVQTLAFQVKPPCLSMIQLMWDYKQLKKDETYEYVQNILSEVKFEDKKDLLIQAIVDIHELLKKDIELSAVSLRDVTRFKELYFWFMQYMPKQPIQKQKNTKKAKKIKRAQNQINNYEIPRQERAIILSLCFCYIFRMENKNRRQLLLNKFEQKLNFKQKYMITVLKNQQKDYIQRLKSSDEKIAFNSTLMQNIFTALVCIINKIPILIVGNPGSSKSMSIRMLASNLKGKSSESKFCQQFAQINMIYFQGSQSSTSDGIQRVFEKAGFNKKEESIQKQQFQKNIFNCILFDEIGLAEKSVHNPLKVLHSKLQTHQKSISFIGISNYELDAAKMSRFLVVAHSNPDTEEVQDTAVKIYESYFPNQNQYKDKFKKFGQYYFEFIERWNGNTNNIINFYGLRDFYNYIKFICEEIGKSTFQKIHLQRICKQAIQTNFDGQKGSLDLFFEIAGINGVHDLINPIDLVRQNLSRADTSRSLMLIIKGDALIPIINENIEVNNEKVQAVCIYGSTFQDDKKSQEYNLETTSRIMSHLSRGTTLAFKDINNNIQTSLYDLFNKSFVKKGTNKTCRISVGANSNPKWPVHQKFNAIVYVQQENIKDLDLPFINRFQKHELNLSTVIDELDWQLLNEIKEWINNVLDSKNNKSRLKKWNYFINSSDQAIITLILKYKKQKNSIDIIKKKLVMNRTTDLDIALKNNPQIVQDTMINELIEGITPYSQNKNDLILFTYDKFSQIGEQTSLIKRRSYPVRLGEIKTEKDLRKTIKQGFKSDQFDIIEIRVDYQKDKAHINFILFLARQLKLHLQCEKQIIVIIKLHRNAIINQQFEELSISFLHNYEQYFVQDLSQINQIEELLSSQNYWQIYQKMELQKMFESNFIKGLNLINLNVQQNRDPEFKKDVSYQAFQMSKNGKFRQNITQIIKNIFSSKIINFNQLQYKYDCIMLCSNIKQAIQTYINVDVRQIMCKFLSTMIEQGLIFAPEDAIQLKEKSHKEYLSNYANKKVRQELQNIYNQHYGETVNVFRINLLEKQSLNKFSKQIGNNYVIILIFASVIPRGYRDIPIIFNIQANKQSNSIQNILGVLPLRLNEQHQNPIFNCLQMLQNTEFQRQKMLLDSKYHKDYQVIYFYDLFMFNMERLNLGFSQSQECQMLNFISNLLQSFNISQKIIFLVYNTSFISLLFKLLNSFFKCKQSKRILQSIIQNIQIQNHKQNIGELYIRLAANVFKQCYQKTTLNKAIVEEFQGSQEYVIRFRDIHQKISELTKDYKDFEQLELTTQFQSINNFIKISKSLLKSQSTAIKSLDMDMIQKFVNDDSLKGSLCAKIFKFVSKLLQQETKPICIDIMTNYLSEIVSVDWFIIIKQSGNDEYHECIQLFVKQCRANSKFANNSTYFFMTFMDQIYKSKNMDELFERVRDWDQNQHSGDISQEWITFNDNFSVALGNFINSIFDYFQQPDQSVTNQRQIDEESNMEKQQQQQLKEQSDNQNTLGIMINWADKMLKFYWKLFNKCSEIKELSPNLSGILAIQFMKFYGKYYLLVLKYNRISQTRQKIQKWLTFDRLQINHFKIYLLKQLYHQQKSFEKIKQVYIEDMGCKWVSQLKQFVQEKKIQYFIPPKNQFKHSSYQENIRKFQNSNFTDIALFHDLLLQVLKNDSNGQDCYQLLNFFMLKLYTKQCSQKNIQILIKQLKQRKDLKEQNIFVSRLLLGYLNHRITPQFQYNEQTFKKQIPHLNFINAIVSYRRLVCPFNEMFFNDRGIVQKNYSQWLDKSFLIGTIKNPAAIRLDYILKTLNKIGVKLVGGSFIICSNTCDFITPVGGNFYGKFEGCPHPTQSTFCPFCKGILGAQAYNVLVNQNNGARVIQPNQLEKEMVRINLKQQINVIYKQKQINLRLKGYRNGRNQQEFINYLELRKHFLEAMCDHMHEEGQMITHKFLQYLFNLCWYFMNELELLDDKTCKQLWGHERKLNGEQLLRNYKFFEDQLKNSLKIEQADNNIIWSLGMGLKLINFINIFSEKQQLLSLLNSFDRNKFEAMADEYFSPFYQVQKEKLIQQSRNLMQQNKTDLIRQVGKSETHQSQYSHIRMFKLIKQKQKLSFQIMKKQYKNTILKNFGVLAYLFYENDIEIRLNHYKNIFTLISLLYEHFNGKIRRHEANSSISIFLQRQQNNQNLSNLKIMLNLCIQSWNELASNNFELTLQCHTSKVLGNLPKISLDQPLKTLLVDNKTFNNEHAGRLLAFIQIAVKDYNQICQTLQGIIINNYQYLNNLGIFSKVHLNPTKISQTQLNFMLFPQQKLKDFVRSLSSQSVEYGISTSHYSFQQIQISIINQLFGKKYLETDKEKYRYFNYIGEQSSFIMELRDRKEQKTLKQLKIKQKIQDYIKQLQMRSEAAFPKTLKEIQASIEQIILRIKNIKRQQQIAEKNQETLSAFRQLRGLSEELSKQPLRQVPIKALADLYQLIEYYSLMDVGNMLDPCYCQNLSQNEEKKLKDLLKQISKQNGDYPKYNEFRCALLRLSGQNLIPMLSDCHQKIADHLCEVQQYWPKGIDQSTIDKHLRDGLGNLQLSKMKSILLLVPIKEKQEEQKKIMVKKTQIINKPNIQKKRETRNRPR